MDPEDYKLKSDAALVEVFNEKSDIYALYLLINERYGRKLTKTIAAFMPPGYDSRDLDDELNEFFHFMQQPTKDGRSRLANFDPARSFGDYIAQCARNYMTDTRAAAQRKDKSEIDATDPASVPVMPTDLDEREAQEFKEMEYLSLLLTLEGIEGAPPGEASQEAATSDRDQYIWLTTVLCDTQDKRPDVDSPLYQQLADQLDMTYSAVKKAGSRVKSKNASKAKKILSNLVTNGLS